jgi:hypothetical protein
LLFPQADYLTAETLAEAARKQLRGDIWSLRAAYPTITLAAVRGQQGEREHADELADEASTLREEFGMALTLTWPRRSSTADRHGRER